MLWRGDEHGRCVYLNRAQRQFWGVPDDGVSTFSWGSTLIEEDAPLVYGPFGEGMQRQAPFTCEARYRRADGAIRILRTEAQPRFDAGGSFTGMVGVNRDVTDERRAQQELIENEARLRALADNLPYGMVYQIVSGPGGANRRFTFVSGRCEALNGVRAEDALADPNTLYAGIVPEDRQRFAATEAEARDARRPFECEIRMRHAGTGEVRWFRIASAPRALPNGEVAWDGVQADIHDIKMADERRRLLMTEMSHRIKNNLSTVLSIAAQTGRAASDYAAFKKSFVARLQAMAKSHDLLMEEARDSADLRDILENELAPYAGDGRTLALEGESVRLTGRAAMSVALLTHELATNAAKYGAYSVGGALDLRWRRTPQGLVALAWREHGGPPAAPPTRHGFGSRLIQSVVAELGGHVEMRFAQTGFEADLTFRTSLSGH